MITSERSENGTVSSQSCSRSDRDLIEKEYLEYPDGRIRSQSCSRCDKDLIETEYGRYLRYSVSIKFLCKGEHFLTGNASIAVLSLCSQ